MSMTFFGTSRDLDPWQIVDTYCKHSLTIDEFQRICFVKKDQTAHDKKQFFPKQPTTINTCWNRNSMSAQVITSSFIQFPFFNFPRSRCRILRCKSTLPYASAADKSRSRPSAAFVSSPTPRKNPEDYATLIKETQSKWKVRTGDAVLGLAVKRSWPISVEK